MPAQQRNGAFAFQPIQPRDAAADLGREAQLQSLNRQRHDHRFTSSVDRNSAGVRAIMLSARAS